MVDEPSSPSPSQIRELVYSLYDAYQRDDWSDGQAEEFSRLLAQWEIARQTYIELVQQRATLRLMLGPAIPIGASHSLPGGPLDCETLAQDIPLLQLGDPANSDAPLASLTWKVWLPVVSLLLGALIAVVALTTGLDHEGGGQVAQQTGDAPAATPVMEIGTMNIESGTVRIRLPRVGYMVVEGPAKLTLVSPMRLELERGRIKLHVTEPSGHGFVVATPHGEITDLGTEFGVDASREGASDLIVFDGAVDLRLPGANDAPARFTRGEGVRFDGHGQFDRIMSIATGNVATFAHPAARVQGEPAEAPVIRDVEDNRRARQTNRFYEIVHGGLRDGADAYVDRLYNWNGAGESDLPFYLRGADYIKTFNDDKVVDVQIKVTLSGAADLYLFWDDRVPPTVWLERDFERLDEKLELEERQVQDRGTDERRDLIRTFSIWHRRLPAAGVVELGSIQMVEARTSMYGIAACRVDPPDAPPARP
jgi:hypothetical protein